MAESDGYEGRIDLAYFTASGRGIGGGYFSVDAPGAIRSAILSVATASLPGAIDGTYKTKFHPSLIVNSPRRKFAAAGGWYVVLRVHATRLGKSLVFLSLLNEP